MAIKQIGGGNQGYIINKVQELFNTDLGEQGKVKAVQGGICYMLSMEWLRRMILEGMSTGVLHFNEQQQVDDNLYYYKQIANNYYNYTQQIQQKKKLTAGVGQVVEEPDESQVVEDALNGSLLTMEAMNEFFVGMGSRNVLEAVNTYKARDAHEMAGIFATEQPQYFMISAFWKKEDQESHEPVYSGHRMAGAIQPGGSITFYDPNDGVYMIDSVQDMLDWILRHYAKFGALDSFYLCVVRDARSNTSGASV